MTRTTDVEPPVTLLFRRGDAFVAVSRNLVGVRWTSIPTGAQLAALASAHRALTRTGAEVLLVNHIVGIARPPSLGGQLHAQIVDLIVQADGPTRAVAHVVEVPGAVGVVIRTFLATLERVAGNGHTRTATFDRATPAIDWLAGVDPTGDLRAEELASAWHAMERAGRSLAA